MHVVRPDGVMRTSVLAPTTTGLYQPVRDAHRVAAQFTRIFGPSGAGLAGPLASWFSRVRFFMQQKKVARAQRRLAKQSGLGEETCRTICTGGPPEDLDFQFLPSRRRSAPSYRLAGLAGTEGRIPGMPNFQRAGVFASQVRNMAHAEGPQLSPALIAARQRAPWDAGAAGRLVGAVRAGNQIVDQRAQAALMQRYTILRKGIR
jgi:hypothetical protein